MRLPSSGQHVMPGSPINWTALCAGCGECCGPTPFSPTWWAGNKHRALRPYTELPGPGERVTPVTRTLDCVFLTDEKRCLVYQERPMVCMLQGTHPKLPCPKLDPVGSEKRGKEIMAVVGR